MAVGRPARRRRRVSAETSPSMPRAARPAGTVCSTRRSRRCRGEYAPASPGSCGAGPTRASGTGRSARRRRSRPRSIVPSPVGWEQARRASLGWSAGTRRPTIRSRVPGAVASSIRLSRWASAGSSSATVSRTVTPPSHDASRQAPPGSLTRPRSSMSRKSRSLPFKIRIRVAGRGPQSSCGLLGRGNLPQGGERWFRPCRAAGGDRPDALSGAESAVRRDRRPRDRQPRPAQFPVGERALPEAHGPVGHTQGASDAAGCHVADREKPAVRPGDPGADAAVPRAGDHGFGEQAVQAQRAVRAVRPA